MQSSLQERVEQAAQTALNRNGSVGPLELFQEMRLLQAVHVEGWRKGTQHYRLLQPWIQVGPEKFQKTIRHFQEWVKQNGLRPLEATYTRRGPGGIEQLQVTADGDPEWEKFYRTHYAPGDLPEKKAARVAAKLNRPPELVVFEKSEVQIGGGKLRIGGDTLLEPVFGLGKFEFAGDDDAESRTSRGLGLVFCRRAAEAHGGTICVAATEGPGTTFRVSLPLAGPASRRS